MSRTLQQLRAALGVTGLLLTLLLAGCGTPGYHQVKPTVLDLAPAELPESRLLDVGVSLTAVPDLSESKLEKQGTNEEVRRAESVFIPFHLKRTVQRSSYWGAVVGIHGVPSYVNLRYVGLSP